MGVDLAIIFTLQSRMVTVIWYCIGIQFHPLSLVFCRYVHTTTFICYEESINRIAQHTHTTAIHMSFKMGGSPGQLSEELVT